MSKKDKQEEKKEPTPLEKYTEQITTKYPELAGLEIFRRAATKGQAMKVTKEALEAKRKGVAFDEEYLLREFKRIQQLNKKEAE